MDKGFNLFKEFSPTSTKEWEEVIKKDLRGADYKEKLKWETGEGIKALPFYRREDLEDLNIPRKIFQEKNEWQIRQPIFDQKIDDANSAAKQAIDRGADGVSFKTHARYTDGMLGGDLEGTAIQSQQDFDELVSGMDLAKTSIHIDGGMLSPIFAAMLHNTCHSNSIDTLSVNGSLMYDPFAFILKNGCLPKDEQQFISETAQLAAFSKQHLPGLRSLAVDARIFHNSGSTIAEELGFALATGSEYLARLTDIGMKPSEVAKTIHFNFSIGSSYFLEIAKFRAARILWQKILQAYGVEKQEMYIHGSTSTWNKTIFDPYVNMLRSSTEGMSAAISGCDAITVNPFDATFDQPDELSQRVARNQQIIFKEEAYLNKVSDPAAGSYYVEQLTDKIAEAAWNCFQEVETQGGMLQSIKDRYIQITIEESRKQQDQKIASRGRIFVGTNQYPNPEEEISPDRKDKYQTVSLNESNAEIQIDNNSFMSSLAKALQNGALMGDLVPTLFDIDRLDIRPLRPYRGAQAFEELRLATQQHSKTPKVLNVPMGDKKMRKARSAFSNNFFGCVGYDMEDPIGYESIDEIVSAIEKHQPDIVVLCSSDDEYPKLVSELTKKIESTDQKPVLVLAGYPKEHIEEFEKAGVDEFIHAKCNVLETLKRFQQKLGIIE
ncbi:MAG: methylmalonyl-CoA mutase family protein [Balneolaceae bacterium]|nr:methylmalonyl-CoA mutase family protein [Balneolaceae bacterium]